MIIEFLKKHKSFIVHPGNYVLISVLAIVGGILISTGVIAGSIAAAMGVSILAASLAIVALPLFLIFRLQEDKQAQFQKLNLDKSFLATNDQGHELNAAGQYTWNHYFFGLYDKLGPAPHKRLFWTSFPGRLLQLAGHRPYQTALAVVAILACITMLICGLGFLFVPAAFPFMANILAPMITAFSTGFAGLGTLAGLSFLGAISAGLITAISVVALSVAPLSVADSINRPFNAALQLVSKTENEPPYYQVITQNSWFSSIFQNKSDDSPGPKGWIKLVD